MVSTDPVTSSPDIIGASDPLPVPVHIQESSDGWFVSYVNSQEFAVSGCRSVSEIDHLLALFPIDTDHVPKAWWQTPRVLHLLRRVLLDGIEGSCIDRDDG